ncbi:MAG: cytochrome c [Chitinophagaceae bacterium]|nr:MAG: cytochrome c [Chitinophagaceae bacterium]
MSQLFKPLRQLTFVGAALFACSSAHVFAAEAPAATPAAAAGPSPAKQAIAVRKATFTLIGNNFKPIGDVLQGKAEYNAAEIKKRAERVAFLSGFLHDTFPEASNVGEPDTKSKAEIWTNRAEFDKKLKEFQEHSATLAQVAAKETSNSEAFKAAAGAVGQDCKSCHEKFKVK